MWILLGSILILSMLVIWSLGRFSVREPRAEVFNIDRNVYRYPEANDACGEYGARLATQSELSDAASHGAHWGSMGWSKDLRGLYPSDGKVKGGIFPPQLKFGVNCYGFKPKDDKVNPFNERKWSQWD